MYKLLDEIIPILTALQHIHAQLELRDQLLDAVARDVNGTCSADHVRPGMQSWSILVLGAVRLGCDRNYDRLQNLAEEHRTPRHIMGIGGWYWYYHDGNAWQPYRFDRQFGREGFERGQYQPPGEVNIR